ncbi:MULTISPECIES: DUF3303 family protein [Streptomyces]|uniref:DUF3303 family protein n=1 Tax=Streptomyces TaxID=1883 RepID=UPI000F6CABFD|nr:DUF3303 family protein [Streptomyces sp. W1SF4]AZM89280.1 hypothetical protein D1J60_12930 [Streptomyces sp. W1SF4]
MRVMLRAHMDTAATNEGITTGGLPQAIKSLMDRVKPEAAYFGLHEGVRSCWIVFDLQDSGQLPSLTWDLFHEFNAEIEVAPVMTGEDLAKALGALRSS